MLVDEDLGSKFFWALVCKLGLVLPTKKSEKFSGKIFRHMKIPQVFQNVLI
jgi:hypothetical protein